jgi:hypothetical protein
VYEQRHHYHTENKQKDQAPQPAFPLLFRPIIHSHDHCASQDIMERSSFEQKGYQKAKKEGKGGDSVAEAPHESPYPAERIAITGHHPDPAEPLTNGLLPICRHHRKVVENDKEEARNEADEKFLTAEDAMAYDLEAQA